MHPRRGIPGGKDTDKVSESSSKRRAGGRPSRPSRREYSGRRVALWLLLCFPAGLFFMWSDRCRWNRFVKTAVSVVIAAVLVVIVLPQTQPPERMRGGVELVDADESLVGPQPTDGFDRIDLYSYNVTSESVLAEPEPTPEPIYVWCNDGGKYYHSEDCEYVQGRRTTVRVPLLQALNAGYQQCPQCNAPEAY